MISIYGATKIGVAVVKNSQGLPPLQKGILGAFSAGASALTLGSGAVAVQSFSTKSDLGGEDAITVKIPKNYFENLVPQFGSIDKEDFLKNLTRKISDFESSLTKASTSRVAVPIGTAGIIKGTSAEVISRSSGTSPGVDTSEDVNKLLDKYSDGGDGGFFIPSIYESFDNLSPLEALINCEILLNLMILFHIFLIALILIKKFNIKIFKKRVTLVFFSWLWDKAKVGFIGKIFKNKITLAFFSWLWDKAKVSFIGKIFNKYKLNSLQNLISKFELISDNYLSILLILNILAIIYSVVINLYVNIELSNNLNEYITVYHKFHFKK